MAWQFPLSGSFDGMVSQNLHATNRIGAHTAQVGSKNVRILMAGEEIIGDLDEDLGEGCRQLVRLSGHAILEVHFVSTLEGAGWLFAGANPFPELREAREIEGVARLLDHFFSCKIPSLRP